MSGGSMNHLYHLVRDAAFPAHSPEREAFRKHLALVANALRSIEWNDSGDGDDQEVHNIMACISLSALENEMLRAEVERLHQAHQAACEGGGLLREEIERLTRERDEARAEIENLYDQIHRWVDDRAKAQSQADRLREQNYELQRERDEARAEIERLRAEIERLTRERNEARAEYARLRDDIERIENDAWHDGAKHGTSH